MATFRTRPDGSIRAVIHPQPNQNVWEIFPDMASAREWAGIREGQIRVDRARAKAVAQASAEHERYVHNQGVVSLFMQHLKAKTTPTLYDALSRYGYEESPQKRGHRAEIRRVAAWQREPLAKLPLDAIRGVDLASYRNSRLTAGKSRSTVRLEIALISHLYTIARTDWGFEWLKNPRDGMRKPKPAPGRQRRCLGMEEALLLDYCDDTENAILRGAIIIATETGMRRGEFAGLTWSSVALDERLVYLDMTKNGDSRAVPLSTRAIEAFQALLPKNMKPSSRVFPLHPDNITQTFQAACKACGITGMRLHDLRHEATSRLFEKGFNEMEVSTITGHKSLQMLKRYTHLDPRRFLDRLG